MKSSRRLSRGATFTEMLVAITIILAAVGMVTPAYYGVRRGAQRMACMNTLSQIAAGMTVYAKNFDDWIIGSPYGSGAYLQGQSQAWGLAVQTWDFMGPLEAQWNMGLPTVSQGDPDAAVVRRFNDLRGHYAFKCAGNDWLAPRYVGPDAGVGPMVSYNTCRWQLWPAEYAPTNQEEHLPPDWRPSVAKIGNPANKVFCADGARYSTCIDPPDYDLSVEGPFGGAFSDAGVYSVWTRSWDRCRAPGNAGALGGHALTEVDPRQYAFRHSTGSPPVGAPANAFKLNVVFYDGHVETQGDLTAANPHQWLPKGTTLETSALWPDAAAIYGGYDQIVIGD